MDLDSDPANLGVLIVVLHPINRAEMRLSCILRLLLLPTRRSRIGSLGAISSRTTDLIYLEVLRVERHTITTPRCLLRCIWIDTIFVKTKTFDSFLEGSFVIEGQPHLNPHQNYRWCDSLVK